MAIKLHFDSKSLCHYKDFTSLIKNKFETDDAAQIDYLRSDVQTCTFLTRDASGNYGFRHKSFMEFFVSQVLSEEIRSNKFDSLKISMLTVEVRSFLIEFLAENPPVEYIKIAVKSSEGYLKDNLTSLISHLKLDILDPELEKVVARSADAKIGTQLLRGDLKAFEDIYKKYSDKVRLYVKSRTAKSNIHMIDNIDDVVSTVFLRVWSRREQIANPENILRDLLQQANYSFHERLRIQSRDLKKAASFEEDNIIDDSTAASGLLTPILYEEGIIDLRELLSDAITTLSPEEAEIIQKYYFGGITTRRIAYELEISSQAVSSRRYRALKKLKGFFEEQSKEVVSTIFEMLN